MLLIHKTGKDLETPSSYRPICLLDEMGKMLEKIIANRMIDHMDRVGPNLSPKQFGFRPGRSTIDAIDCVKQFTGEAEKKENVRLESLWTYPTPSIRFRGSRLGNR